MKSMENKTIEEMNSAVIQEINRLCPNDFNLKELDHGLIVKRLQKGVSLYIPDPIPDRQLHDLIMWFPFRDATDSQVFSAYRWLGLEARDAVEAEKARNTVLEEALEAIIYQDEVNGKGWENDSNSTYSRLCRALEAHKKGGAEQ